MAREVVDIVFTPGDADLVLAQMVRLLDAGSGWINFLPGSVDEEAKAPDHPSVFSTLYGMGVQPPVTLATWIPPRRGRRNADLVTIGIMHPRGRYAIKMLEGWDIHLPDGWRTKQDHNRRGLIVLAPVTERQETVLDWTIRATSALATTELTGAWKARVFQPDQVRSA